MTFIPPRASGLFVILVAAIGQVMTVWSALPTHPVLAPSTVSPRQSESGETLLAGLQCTACHLPDGLKARLTIEGLAEGHVHEMHFPGIKSVKGQPLLHPSAYYTLNYIPANTQSNVK